MNIEKYKKYIVIIIITLIIYEGYSIWKSYSNQEGIDEGGRIGLPTEELGKIEDDVIVDPIKQPSDATPDDRDNQRVKDLNEIGNALDEYAKFNGGKYPVTNGYEKISDENSDAYRALSRGGYFRKNYKDPLSDIYFYGYKSNGAGYELTASFEDKKDSRCEEVGDYCIYTYKKL